MSFPSLFHSTSLLRLSKSSLYAGVLVMDRLESFTSRERPQTHHTMTNYTTSSLSQRSG